MKRDRYGYLVPSSCRYPGALVCPCDYCTQDPDDRPRGPRERDTGKPPGWADDSEPASEA